MGWNNRRKAPRALPHVHCEKIEERVTTLTRNLFALIPPFPLNADELDLYRMSPDVLSLAKHAHLLYPRILTKVSGFELELPSGEEFHMTLKTGGVHRRPDPAGLAGHGLVHLHQPPAEYVTRIEEWLRIRHRIGGEITVTRSIVLDVLDRLTSPAQVKKVWPNLLEYAVGFDERLDKKLSSISQRTANRTPLPGFWNDKWQAAVDLGTMALTRAAVIERYDDKRAITLANYNVPKSSRWSQVFVAPWSERELYRTYE